MSEESVALKKQTSIDTTYQNIREILEKARSTAYRAVNFVMVQAYWEIGRIIVEEEQKGEERAKYGKALIKELSRRLTQDYGKGFIERNLWYMKDFYLTFPKVNALRSELTWTHYRLLLKVEKEEARDFYMLEAIKDNWSTRELERQINSLLFERLALSEDKRKVLEFYNYVLKCFVLIDLKVGKLTHQDIGQMDFYVRYFEKLESDNSSSESR